MGEKGLKLDQVNIKTLDFMIGSELYNSLDKDKYSDIHYLCCLETGLGRLPLRDLKIMKNNFLKEYYANNKDRLFEKIKQFGQPYEKAEN